MISQNFLYSLSSTIAEHFLKKLDSSSLNISNKEIKVVRKTHSGSVLTPCNVEDYIVQISFSDFAKFADQCQADKIESSLKQKVWTECTKGKGDGLMEIFINSYVREKGAFYDVTIRKIKAKEFKILCFRKSADLITQHPLQKQCKPIYQDSFDLLQEVCQGEYAITCADDKKPVLASWHFANCVGFVAFSEIHKIGILAHIDSVANYECLFTDMKKIFITEATSSLITIEYVLVGRF